MLEYLYLTFIWIILKVRLFFKVWDEPSFVQDGEIYSTNDYRIVQDHITNYFKDNIEGVFSEYKCLSTLITQITIMIVSLNHKFYYNYKDGKVSNVAGICKTDHGYKICLYTGDQEFTNQLLQKFDEGDFLYGYLHRSMTKLLSRFPEDEFTFNYDQDTFPENISKKFKMFPDALKKDWVMIHKKFNQIY